MNLVSFEKSLCESVELLKEIGLFGVKGIKVIHKDDVSSEFKSASQQANYSLVYQTGIQNFDYDFTLQDHSFFQFSIKEIASNSDIPEARFAFFQNPKNFITYKEFLEIQRQLDLIDESDDEIGELYFDEYEQYLDEEQLNMASTTIRYDIDLKNYDPLIHSTSHIHIGHLNNIRIPCDKILTPMKFVLFVIKHIYYYHWKSFVEENNERYNAILNTAKNTCTPLNKENWKENKFGIHENRDIFLT